MQSWLFVVTLIRWALTEQEPRVLTRDHAIAEYEFASGRVRPDRLTQKTHKRYIYHAQRMLRIYENGAGKTRRELHRGVESVFARERDCPARRIAAFCKLLDDVSVYQHDACGDAARLRIDVFRMAGQKHPLVTKPDRLFKSGEAEVKQEIARQLGRPWNEIERDLFADVPECHRLGRFGGYPSPQALLARYNVAQLQVALYDAVSMTVWARHDFKTILRYAKLARLMHTITRLGESHYRIRLDGPASIMRCTRRYGVNLAKFLPALVACRNWRLHAQIRTRRRGWVLSLDLSSEDGLHSHLPAPNEFDSRVEEAFANRWGHERREGWKLEREGEVLHHGQKTFVPDFVFRHEDGRSVLMEIVGFWTPEYLDAKQQTLRTFRGHNILLAIAKSVKAQLPDVLENAITYKSKVLVKDVLDRLHRVP
jgi:predicted nuclease of restriction endonuclease-like RecB superfamily